MDEFGIANVTGLQEHYKASEVAARQFDEETNDAELNRIIAYLEDHQAESVGQRVLRGDVSLPQKVISCVFREWIKRREVDKIATAFTNAGKLHTTREILSLTDRAIQRGLDPYEVKERVAILVYDAGWPEWKAIEYALGGQA